MISFLTDKPVRDSSTRDAEAERIMNARPVCDFCGYHVLEEYYDFSELDGRIVCTECIDKWLKPYKKSVEW